MSLFSKLKERSDIVDFLHYGHRKSHLKLHTRSSFKISKEGIGYPQAAMILILKCWPNYCLPLNDYFRLWKSWFIGKGKKSEKDLLWESPLYLCWLICKLEGLWTIKLQCFITISPTGSYQVVIVLSSWSYTQQDWWLVQIRRLLEQWRTQEVV